MFTKDASLLNKATGWHMDLVLVPLDVKSGGYVTFWCHIGRRLDSRKDSVLMFSAGSHRDLAMQYWYGPPASWDGLLAERFVTEMALELDVGDCTAHHGWMMHKAHKQNAALGARNALAFSYVSANAMPLPDLKGDGRGRADRPFHMEDELSFRDWFYDVPQFKPVDHPLIPLVYG
ncbi:unnamed protein product [Prorocentrum cordatum]|uniref:Phytanoyl-CoA dioxygenase n=1 Tax=Prorocentrum cordatum TaxID=2364126 RepID=A0ABN9Y2J1_9DINO|nr:unnamed protein product [Polarella glacialis]